MVPLLIATRNAHKTAEFTDILGGQFAISDLSSLANGPEVEETGRTFEENATLKAVAISEWVPDLVVADDSGLEVDALGGAPGVYSARYAGGSATDEQNVAKLLNELQRVGASSGARARFRCALVVARASKKLASFHGTSEGSIIQAPRGHHGFGYDPVFIPSGYEQTFAELGEQVKNTISHRGKAIELLRRYLEAHISAT